MRARRLVLGLLVLLGLTLGGAVQALEPLVLWAMRPKVAFDEEAPPAAPDYADPASWSALPERVDLADEAPDGLSAIDPARAAADVFYVHPTSYVGPRWNAPVDDPSLNAATDRVATMIQAGAFNGCCAVWAPRYRQANGTSFLTPSADGAKARELAYADVRRAFDAFQARRGAGRPFLLVAHSQGSVMAQRLLEEAISGTPLRDQLVAAWLIGGTVTVEGLRERAPDLPPCGAPEQTGCVIAWNARGPGYLPGRFELQREDARPLLCTNPLSWRDDGVAMPAEANLGAVFLESRDRAPRPAFADAACVDGTLVVSRVGRAPRDLMSRVLDRVLGEGNHHPIEYQMYFMNIRENAERRVVAMTKGS